ncbi:short-chain dehydrogenase [Saccharothrix sp. ALI-22-I]|uniref:SDR family NAD(P)-dependent oxidoreductase n=1 Tax=Saccharothrix sp. ALI-22-I TaxID=1933778 RepID=UPI00097C744A|nr:SDR family oxidoreductase [Saccharothrix sp. ALI-22-I]ONI87735.1 short-chain dehydrogenase [Saccharothrix sp. ALI-22-I]
MPTALVTGATAGIGAEFTRHLAGDGCDLVLVARDEERLARTAAALRTDHGVAVEVLVADLATDDGIAAVERRVAQGVDLVVNNAGFGQRGDFLTSDVAEELAMLKVHCEAVLRITRAALGPMLERGSGGVINVASVAAFFSRGTYSASKGWVVTFSDSVRQQINGSGVHVMALCPGWVRTEFHQRSGMDTAGIPGFLWLDATRLVTGALRDLRRGVAVSVPGLPYRILIGLGRVLPRRATTRLAARAGSRHAH